MKSVRAAGIVLAAAVILALTSCGRATPPATGGLPSAQPLASSPSPAALPSPSPSPAPAASPSPSPSPSPPPTPPPPPPPSPSPQAAAHRIVISLAQQHLWAYDGKTLIVDTIVATGRPELPTITGHFKILNKYSPFQFISPWPPSSPYWYEPVWTSYAMEFQWEGYFIHDAPWRTDWGPGADVRSGSHGCVNVPLKAMAQLYSWARVGDPVTVEP